MLTGKHSPAACLKKLTGISLRDININVSTKAEMRSGDCIEQIYPHNGMVSPTSGELFRRASILSTGSALFCEREGERAVATVAMFHNVVSGKKTANMLILVDAQTHDFVAVKLEDLNTNLLGNTAIPVPSVTPKGYKPVLAKFVIEKGVTRVVISSKTATFTLDSRLLTILVREMKGMGSNISLPEDLVEALRYFITPEEALEMSEEAQKAFEEDDDDSWFDDDDSWLDEIDDDDMFASDI